MQLSIFFLGNVDAGWTWCMLLLDTVCCMNDPQKY